LKGSSEPIEGEAAIRGAAIRGAAIRGAAIREASLEGEPAPVDGCTVTACPEKLYSVWRRPSNPGKRHSVHNGILRNINND